MLRSPKTGVHSVGVGLICTLESNWLECAERFGTERRVLLLKRLSIRLDTLLYDREAGMMDFAAEEAR